LARNEVTTAARVSGTEQSAPLKQPDERLGYGGAEVYSPGTFLKTDLGELESRGMFLVELYGRIRQA
jgi:hypothetical protein